MLAVSAWSRPWCELWLSDLASGHRGYNSSGCAPLELFERFHVAMVGDPCLTAIYEGGENIIIVEQYNIGYCSEDSF